MSNDQFVFENQKCTRCGKKKAKIYQHGEQKLCQPCLKKTADEARYT